MALAQSRRQKDWSIVLMYALMSSITGLWAYLLWHRIAELHPFTIVPIIGLTAVATITAAATFIEAAK